jgi:hypothetical protein
MAEELKKLVLPPDASGTKTHPWFQKSPFNDTWTCQRDGLDGMSLLLTQVARDGKLIDPFSAYGISAMWSAAYHVPGHKMHSLDWFYAANGDAKYSGRKVVGFEER